MNAALPPLRTAARLAGLAALIATLAGAAPAQETRLSPEEFDALSKGSTWYFTLDGEPYGAEQYLDGRRSIWAFDNGTCQRGVWFSRGGDLCFLYEDSDAPSCWAVVQTPSGLKVRTVERDAPVLELDVARVAREPLACKAPGLGV